MVSFWQKSEVCNEDDCQSVAGGEKNAGLTNNELKNISEWLTMRRKVEG